MKLGLPKKLDFDFLEAILVEVESVELSNEYARFDRSFKIDDDSLMKSGINAAGYEDVEQRK